MSKGAKDQLSEKELATLKASSNVSEDELRKGYEDFKKDCPSGKLSKAQFNQYFKKMTGSGDQNEPLLDHLFAAFDTNANGSVDFQELVLGIALMNKTDLDSKLNFSYGMLDISEDGYISFDEVKKFMTVAKSTAGDTDDSVTPDFAASLVFSMFNVDKGQKLSKQQFIDGCKKNDQLKKIFGHH